MSNLTVKDNWVVTLDYSLHVDGELVDSSQGHDPLDFIQGIGNIIPGLESKLYGMKIGDSKKVVVSAADGYGDLHEEAFVDVPRGQFPGQIPLEVGTEIQVRDEQGNPMAARIAGVSEQAIKLDFNHPLAGKELHFDVTIVGLREATEEEMAHGHVHHGHEH